MKKLLALFDEYILKIGVLFTVAFVALYPKLPSIHIVRTWVYIRLEDFVIAAVVALWVLQFARRKVKLPLPVSIPIGMYWLVGLVSLLFSLVFIGPHLSGFFPHLAILEYLRRIEYMILFFVAFSTVKSAKDVRDYVVILCLTAVAVVLYGFGQRYYLLVWSLFPKFFETYSFCFPSFQTGNEEFAKGLALCLPQEARITSTFGGHYDLAAYLVLVLPLFLGVFFAVKKMAAKVGVALLYITSLILLLFTASRVSFFSYLIGAIVTLLVLKKKKWIIPVVGISIVFLFVFSQSTAKRLFETFRIVNVITTNQGQVVGLAESNLPSSLKSKISKTDSVIVEAPPPTQNLPTGSSFITLSQTAVATTNAYVRNPLSTSEAQKLKLASGGLEISTVSGNFLIQKALVYDISFTTRFQAEWPNAWAAFSENPLLGKGYSTITLATDNDYLRLLGETGLLGFVSFLLIFTVFGIFLRESMGESTFFVKAFAVGLAGGVAGLFANASLIDVFEASKVAEPLWILLGVAIGGLSLTFSGKVAYLQKIKKIVSSHFFLIILLCILVFIMFGGGLMNFFVADDFTWLKWAAIAHPSDFLHYFVDAQGLIYRPVAKILMLLMYSIFSFQPAGYHVVSLFVHFFIMLGVYVLGLLVFKKKLWAWILAALYGILPIHAENLFWISTISINWSVLFITYSLVAYAFWRQGKNSIFYVASVILCLLALFTFELGVVLPLLLLAIDMVLLGRRFTKQLAASLAPFVVLDAVYLYVRAHVNVAPISGDYSYNLSHLIPNVIANFTNYIFASFIGERVVAWQYTLRLASKMHVLPITVGLLIAVGVAAVLCAFFWKRVNKTLLRYICFGFAFACIGFLPFLGLGNMSDRYGYLGSFGFVFIVVSLARYVSVNKYTKVGFAILAIAFFFFAKQAVSSELQQWVRASKITYNTLAYFRVVQPDLPGGATLYISNMPTKYGNAWIFPVGFEDGLWFIYRDDTLKVIKTPSVDASLAIKMPHVGEIRGKEFVFEFDKNGQILQY